MNVIVNWLMQITGDGATYLQAIVLMIVFLIVVLLFGCLIVETIKEYQSLTKELSEENDDVNT